jgi:uncharacterized SAM-dependent methyltransferase
VTLTELEAGDSANQPKIEGHLPPGERSLPGDVLAGLTATPKAIPPKHFYDPVGSELFERITRLPEYYPTRAEREIQRTNRGARSVRSAYFNCRTGPREVSS